MHLQDVDISKDDDREDDYDEDDENDVDDGDGHIDLEGTWGSYIENLRSIGQIEASGN